MDVPSLETAMCDHSPDGGIPMSTPLAISAEALLELLQN